MPFSFAIFSADCPIDSPVDGSAMAGVTGTRSRGRTCAKMPSRWPSGLRLARIDEEPAEAPGVQHRDVGEGFDAAGDDHVGVTEARSGRRRW